MCYFCGRMRRIFKKHGTIVKNALLISIVSLVVWACTVDDMRLSYQHTVQFGIYSTNTKADTTLTNFSARGFGEDSLLYDKEASVTQIFLNANLNADSAVAMPHIMDQILPFLEEDVIKKAGSSVDATVDNPDIPVPDWAMDDYKSLY